MRLTLSSYGKLLTFAVIVCIGLAVMPGILTASSLTLPIVQQPLQHEAYQFGYDPNYVVNVPVFDSLNRPYIRGRAGNPWGVAATGYIQTFRDGQWIQLDFTAAVMAKYWDFEQFEKYNGYGGGRIVFDADDDMYTWVVIKRTNGYDSALIYSSDYGETFQVYTLPGGTYDIEHWVGHNTLNRPPLLCRFSTPVGDDPNVTIDVLQPTKELGGLSLGSLVNVTNKGMYLTRHSGHSSFAVSTEEGVFN